MIREAPIDWSPMYSSYINEYSSYYLVQISWATDNVIFYFLFFVPVCCFANLHVMNIPIEAFRANMFPFIYLFNRIWPPVASIATGTQLYAEGHQSVLKVARKQELLRAA